MVRMITTLVHKAFSSLCRFMTTSDLMREEHDCDDAAASGREIQYKWWGDDRYEPV
jgi:hypothetical protein